ncbi:MAG: hypothetical protein H0X37_07065 [Herpetosiphonaceae bacterium]|nr:hypothetical protein [Herpetosiphonaceae bacterium]
MKVFPALSPPALVAAARLGRLQGLSHGLAWCFGPLTRPAAACSTSKILQTW